MSVNYSHVVMEGHVWTLPGPTTATVYQGIQDLIVELVSSDNMGLKARKPVFGIGDHVRLKLACSASEMS